MALQDLTPQLRTRLNRMERAVGVFVLVATVLLLVGFGYFLRSTAKRKGWFTPKFKYQTSLNNAAGLKEGDAVRLMGFPAGKILKIEPNDPTDYYGVTVTFDVMQPHYGYIWDDSKVKVNSDLLGNRFLEISKGKFGVPTINESTNRMAVAMLQWKAIRAERKTVEQQLRTTEPELEKNNPATFQWLVKERLLEISATNAARFYTNLSAVYWFDPEESPAVNERVEQLVNKVEAALPSILDLTNKINAVLGNSATLASNLNVVALGVRPVISNVTFLTTELRGPGALGQWALGTNGQQSLDSTLANANLLLAHSDTNLLALMESFGESLENLAAITSNLNAQVQANTNMLGSISQAVVNTDDLVQGLKRHWLLRSAFKKKPTGK
jgi:ABC-type transporter Mla subunit MlaD